MRSASTSRKTSERPARPSVASPYISETESVPGMVSRAHRQDKTRFEMLLANTGVASATQWMLLTRIRDSPGITGSALARQIAVSPQAVNVVLAQLQSKDFIRRARDGRTVQAQITEAGMRALRAAEPGVLNFYEGSIGTLTRSERDQLMGLLAKYVESTAPQQ